MNKLKYAFIICVFAVACKSNSNEKSTAKILTFKKNDTTVSITVSTADTGLFSGFQEYLDTHLSDSMSYQNIEIADVTGDGISDSCITNISLILQLPFIEHQVISNGVRLFYDTLTLDNPIALFWADKDSSYLAFKPFSGMFIAERYFGHFVGDSVNGVNNNWSYFLNVLHKDEVGKWENYLASYKGRWIWYLDVSGGGGMIWDPNKNKFIFFWGPG